MKDVERSAQQHARSLIKVTDEQLIDEYIRILTDPRERDFSPYLVTHIREQGLWDRLERAHLKRRRDAAP